MTYEAIHDKFNNLINFPTDKLLACVNRSNQILGVLGLINEPEDKYIQAQGGIYAVENYLDVGNEFMRYIKRNYHGHKMVFGYPKENLEGQELMKIHGFKLDESATVTSLYKDKLIEHHFEDDSVVALSEDWYEKYISFSKPFEVDHFWSAEKIIKHQSQWRVYLLIKNETIIGVVETQLYNETDAEVMGLNILDEYKNEDNIICLLYTNCKHGFDSKVKQYTMFIYTDLELKSAKKLGFKEEDTHLSFSKVL
jgi:hypothetical protein